MANANKPDKPAPKLSFSREELAAIISAAIAQASPKAERTYVREAHVDDVQDRRLQRDVAVVRGFKRRGFKEADIRLRDNVRPYKLWLSAGRVVRKGEHGVRGLFHVSQTDSLPVQPKVEIGNVPVGTVLGDAAYLGAA